MKLITAQKIPVKMNFIETTKSELLDLKNKYPEISIGSYDENWMENFNKDDFIGYIAGDIGYITKDIEYDNKFTPDLWFINSDYFKSNYKVV